MIGLGVRGEGDLCKPLDTCLKCSSGTKSPRTFEAAIYHGYAVELGRRLADLDSALSRHDSGYGSTVLERR